MRALLTLFMVVSIVGSAFYFGVPLFSSEASGNLRAADTYLVEKGRLEVTITEAATIEAAKSENIRSQVPGRATLLWLIEEGKTVENGQKVAELDVSQIKDREETQNISVSRALSALVTAEKSLEIQRNQNASDIERSENNLLFAKLDLEKFLGKETVSGNENQMGERKQQLVAARADIQLAEEELERAKTQFDGTKRLFGKNYVTKRDLEADRIAVLRAENNLRVNKNRLFILENYSLKKTEIELQAMVKEAQAELQRVKLRCAARLAQQEADYKSKKQQYDLEVAKLEKLRGEIKAGTLFAPSPGLVVYAQVGGRRRMSSSPIEEGSEVHQGQSVIILPDITSMRAKTSIHESQIDKVAAGQLVTMKVDAFPGRPFFGRISRVSVVPDSSSSWFNPEIKLYTTEIELDGDTTMLRPGQSASVEIRVADLSDVLAIPVQAIQRQGRVLYVWKKTPGGPVAVHVKIGISNDKHVRILEGLAEGDVVFLSEPEGVAAPDFTSLNRKLEEEAQEKEDLIRNGSLQTPPRPPERGAVEASARPPLGDQERGPRRGRPMGSGRSPEAMAEWSDFFSEVKKRFPGETEGMENLFGIFRNPGLRAKIQNDPVLGPRYEELRSRMRGRAGPEGRGRGGMRGGGNRPREGGGEGGRRGNRSGN